MLLSTDMAEKTGNSPKGGDSDYHSAYSYVTYGGE